MQAMEWKADYAEFNEAAHKFYAGELPASQYKGISGAFGSYAQRGGQASMLRLRMTAGRVTKEKLAFVAKAIRKYDVDTMHFTTCQAIQLHNLSEEAVTDLAAAALEAGIVTRGGGGDFPRNVMCSPLTGLEKGEYFNVLPYAEAAGEFLMGYIKTVKLPRKLKVCFSNSPANIPHATFRDLGFVARPDGLFDVYSAGGLGNNPRMGVKVGEAVTGDKLLYYIQAMVDMFTTYGNYTNRAKARTRYMQEVLGDSYAEEFRKKLEAVLASRHDLDMTVSYEEVSKTGDGSSIDDPRAIPQKQAGLYSVVYHPQGGTPDPRAFCALADKVAAIEGAEMRLDPHEAVWIVNLTGEEAKEIIAMTPESAGNDFEASVACIGAAICQVGVRDSQAALAEIMTAAKKWDFSTDYLPQMHISGCPSSCGTHQIGDLGFRGGAKKVDGVSVPAFVLFVGGSDIQEDETFGEQFGTIAQSDMPAFLEELGRTLAGAGEHFTDWYPDHTEDFREIAGKYTN